MHPSAMAFVCSAVERLPILPGPVIEIGGRNINGTVRPLFAAVGPYASLDLYDGPGVDWVADVCTLNPARAARTLFGRPTVTCVVCCEVFEHAVNGKGLCRWAYRVLAPGGVLILTAASPTRPEHSGIDGGTLRPGEHYHGVSRATLRAWLTGFTRTEYASGLDGQDVYAVAWKGRRRQ